jgi:hypothetical protein
MFDISNYIKGKEMEINLYIVKEKLVWLINNRRSLSKSTLLLIILKIQGLSKVNSSENNLK